jgi:magnesium transporter
MDELDRPTVQRSASDLAEEVKTRSADGAASKLKDFGGAEIAAALMRLSPAFAQDVLAALPDEARERALAAVPAEVAGQWQKNSLYDENTVGRMMEPVLAAFPPAVKVGETIEALREMVKSAFITYVYVLDPDERLLGIVTMRDLLFSDNSKTLGEVMIKDVFALHASARLEDAMKQVLDRHYPVYPVIDAERHLIGLVRGQAMFEAQAIEISLQAGTMMGVDKEERIGTPWLHSLKLRHPWLQLNLLTAFLAAAVVGMFQDTIDRLVILALFLPVLAALRVPLDAVLRRVPRHDRRLRRERHLGGDRAAYAEALRLRSGHRLEHLPHHRDRRGEHGHAARPGYDPGALKKGSGPFFAASRVAQHLRRKGS